MDSRQFLDESAYLTRLIAMLEAIEREESGPMDAAADLVYDSITNGGLLHVFSTGHSHMIADEMFYRAGGLIPINPILDDDFMPHKGAVRSTVNERLPGKAAEVLDKTDFHPMDTLLISSNTGINTVPVEAALYAKERSIKVIGITSTKVSAQLPPRHPGGLRLFEVCDVIIDNHVPQGDGLVHIPANGQPTGGASTLASLFIAQCITLKVENRYISNGLLPPVYRSANISGGDEHNDKLLDRYKARIHPLNY